MSAAEPTLDVSMSAECAELFAALAAFQGEVQPPKKGSVNPHFKSKFADLADVLDAVRGPLTKHGLSLTQMPVGSCDGYVRIVTLIGHKSGQWLKGVLDMPLAQKTPQGVGSAISYARRYCAMAALGIAAEDDDGEAAERGKPAQAQQGQPAQNQNQQDSQRQAAGLKDTRPVHDAAKVIVGLLDDLAKLQPDRETLRRFHKYASEELTKCRADQQQNIIIQKAFGERCRAVGLKPADCASGGKAA